MTDHPLPPRYTAPPIVDAYTRDLPHCPRCQAQRGDACRSPACVTRVPHVAREQLYRELWLRKEATDG
jgi:tRNA(Ile2) C34 agmatinyltransferase TiaS